MKDHKVWQVISNVLLREVLEPLTKELVVVQPTGSRATKNDSKDAWGLAQGLREGSLEKVIYKAPRKHTELRAAVKTQRALTRDLSRAKLQVRAQFTRLFHIEPANGEEPKSVGEAPNLAPPPYRIRTKV